MGKAIGARLIEKEYNLSIWNRTKSNSDDLIKSGGNFFNKVREGYLKIAEENRERIYKVNGIDTIENIHKRILEHVGEKIGSSLG